jgi:hypothetical protein
MSPKKIVNIIAILVVILTLVLIFARKDSSSNPTTYFAAGDPAPPALDPPEFMYANPISSFKMNNRNIIITGDTPVNIEIFDSLIYKYGYMSLDGKSWQLITLSSDNPPSIYKDWFSKNAQITIILNQNSFGTTSTSEVIEDNYIILYSCADAIDPKDGWNCQGGLWQLMQFNATIDSRIVKP